MASTAEELASQAEQLQASIAFFKLDQGASSAAARRQTPSIRLPRSGNPPKPAASRRLAAHSARGTSANDRSGGGIHLELCDKGSEDGEFARY